MNLLSLIYLAYYQPYGQGDAWAIWNLKARFIYREGGIFWKNLYSPIIEWSHPNYPLMLPMSVARIWTWGHVENVRASMYLAVVFSYAIILFLYASVNYMRGRLNAILATLILISTPFFLTHGTSQYADVVLSLFYLAVLILINHIGQDDNGKHRLIILIGLVSSMACWVKNEGLLFFVAMFLSTAIVLRKKIVLFLLGAFPVIIVLFVHNFFVVRQNISLPYDLITPITRLLDYSRHYIAIKKFITEIFYFGQWKINPWLLLIFILIFFRKKIISKEAVYFRMQIFVMLWTIVLYYLAYIFSSFALDWYLERSLNRLLIQLWPCFVYIFFLRVNINLKDK